MGLFDRFRRPSIPSAPSSPKREVAVAASKTDVSLTFADRSITFGGSLSGYDYNAILRDKQGHINDLYELADYYVDADPLFRGIIKQVYVPFSTMDGFRLVGANRSVKEKYLKYYERIGLAEKMESIFLQFYKYGQVVVYLTEDGRITTLPIHLCRIGNIEINGEPLVEFNCESVRRDFMDKSYSTLKEYSEDAKLDVRLHGYPREIEEGLKKNAQWVQLNPDNTFVLQDLKEDWVRYAIPMIAACLKALEKKERISNYENSLIDLGARAFVHVTYGDPENKVIPDKNALTMIATQFRDAMTGGALAVTNNWAKANVVQIDLDEMWSDDKYHDVNNDILSAGGISGILVSGRADDGSTFATAQVSMATAANRIRRAKEAFCEMMDKINRRINTSGGRLTHSADANIPRFTFPPTDLSGSKQFQETCKYLFEKGLLSHESLMKSFGMDMNEQVEMVKDEEQKGIHDVLAPSDKDDCRTTSKDSASSSTGKRGRPTMSDDERNSDPSKSASGRQPKGSNPEGSEAQDGGVEDIS